MHTDRRGGVLLHPTSLPSEYGIGDLGSSATHFLEWLIGANCRVWQILPLNPPGFGNSPYSALSAFAGNPLLISPEGLLELGLVTQEECEDAKIESNRLDYQQVISVKQSLLRKSFERFQNLYNNQHQLDVHDIRYTFIKEYGIYCELQKDWLDGWSWFVTFKKANEGTHWREWGTNASYSPIQLSKITDETILETKFQAQFEQFLFDYQWSKIRRFANENDILILGDMPLFVAEDSADVWCHLDLFDFDKDGFPKTVAGVPPDYFSVTGQLWGNPQYAWKRHEKTKFRWWVSRIQRVLYHCDLVRLDHFRGLCASWSVPFGSENAIHGKWKKAPGNALLSQVKKELGEVPLVAEDLGIITPDVTKLRDKFDLPGMKILHFAFQGDGSNMFLPHHYPENCIAYSGTHDNNTSIGWYFDDISEAEQDFARRYLGVSGEDIAWDLIRAIWRSNARFAIAPMQDLLSLPSSERMNLPGTVGDNWDWRLTREQLTPFVLHRLKDLNLMYSRIPVKPWDLIIPEQYPL